jgi:NADP-dependent 3-hydroxy acid dehydrogenase YdfG
MIPNRLAGKHAFITGGGSGIGRATALLFAKAGVDISLSGRRIETLQETERIIREESPSVRVQIFVADVRDTARMEAVCSAVTSSGLDILVNNAGLALGLEPLDKYAPEDIDTVIDTDVKALLQVTRLIGGFFRAQNTGHIINVGSIAGQEAYPGGSVYNAAKFAVHGITKAVKMDFHGTNVRVSEVSPGMVETDFSRVRFKGDAERAAKVYAGTTPLTAEDIAEIIYFQANAAPHVNILDSVVYPVSQSAATMVHRNV